MSGAGRARRPPAALTAPAVAAVALVLLPLVYLVVRAGSGGADAFAVLGRDTMVRLVVDTLLLVIAVTAAAAVVAVPLAWLVARSDMPGRRIVGVAAALPLVIPSYVAALALIGAFAPRGMLQGALEGPFGVERVPEIYGFTGAFLALLLSTYPYVYLLVVAALRRLDPSLEEAARALGRSRLEAFRLVTLPALRPAIGGGSLLVALYVLSDFGAVSLMRYDSLTRAVFLQYRSLFDRRPAAVLALVLVVLTALALVLETAFRRRAGAPAPAVRSSAPARLGRWRWPAFAACSGIVAVAFVVPVAVLVYWALRGRGGGIETPAWEPAANSLLAAGGASIAAVAAALPIAFLAVRYPSPLTRLLERLSYSSNALPGIVIALSLVFFAATYATPIYQTFSLLLVAYVVRFLPEAVAGAHSALSRVDPRLEEAARSLGRPPLSAFMRVTAPLLAPGLLAGGTLVFLSTMKELPATLLLRPIGFDTLATEVWTGTAVGGYAQASASALVLIALAAPLVYVLTVRESIEDETPAA